MASRNELLERIVTHDGIVHYPRGGGSYVFQDRYADYIAKNISKNRLRISVGAQPNSTPHFGTLVVFNLAYSLGQQISECSNIQPEILFEVIDTAPAKKITHNNIEYQISLRENSPTQNYLADYIELMGLLKDFSGIAYSFRGQNKFNAHPKISTILKHIVKYKNHLSPILDPQHELLRMRVACKDCGLTDKKGINNRYHEKSMESYCPNHGWFETSYDKESEKFEYNTPLRNLVRGILYAYDNQNQDIEYEWLRVTGSDYAGYYQEQLLYKSASRIGISAHKLPTIVYAPLVVDWSGAKLSKSLYVQENAYKDLPPYLVNYNEFKNLLGIKGVKKMFNEVSSWVEEPHKLFRNYSVYYFMELFEND